MIFCSVVLYVTPICSSETINHEITKRTHSTMANSNFQSEKLLACLTVALISIDRGWNVQYIINKTDKYTIIS